jgi:hypothetical protein
MILIKRYIIRKDNKEVGNFGNIKPTPGNKTDAVVVVKLINLVSSNT